MRISDWSSDVCSSDLEKRSAAVSASQTRSDNLSTTYSIFGLIILVGALGMGLAANAALSDRRSASRLAEAESLRADDLRSEEHTSELQSLMRISYAVFCLQKKTNKIHYKQNV